VVKLDINKTKIDVHNGKDLHDERTSLIIKIKEIANLSENDRIDCLTTEGLRDIYNEMIKKKPLFVIASPKYPDRRNRTELISALNQLCGTYFEDFSCVSTRTLQKIFDKVFPYE